MSVDKLATLVSRAHAVMVFTGAGISTRSGIPDFRGPKGLWTTMKPVYYDEFMTDHDARVRYWQYKLEGWHIYARAEPNAVHRSLVVLEEAGRLLGLVTQNVDGLHRVAGTSADKLVELHGTDREIECQSCGDRLPPGPCFDAFEATGDPPLCDLCGGYLKPATISFGQALYPAALERAAAVAHAADLVIALGSTLSVHPAAAFPLMAADRGVPYVIVNRGPTDHDGHPSVTVRLEGDVTDLVPPAIERGLSLGATQHARND